MSLAPLLIKVLTFQQGAGLAALVTLGSWGLGSLLPGIHARLAGPALALARWLTLMTLLGTVAYALSYLAYPNFIDHVEATVAALGYQMLHGQAIYPSTDVYSVNGLLYGPLLAEMDAAAMWLTGDPMLGAKLPGVLSFLLAAALAWRLLPDARVRCYMMLAAPFALFLFFNRAEPHLLLLAVLTLAAQRFVSHGLWRLICVGILMGLAAALKLHGCLYVFIAFIASSDRDWRRLGPWCAMAGVAALTLGATFMPHAASLAGFVHYLGLAGHHGLSSRLLVENLVYVAVLWLPLGIAYWATQAADRQPIDRPRWLAVAFLQVVVAIVASKRGAGLHHLMPLIPVNAWLLSGLLGRARPGRSMLPVWLMYCSLFLTSATKLIQDTKHLHDNWDTFQSAQDELLRESQRYPGLVVSTGLTSESNALTYLRLLLQVRGTPQIDYPAYMDLQISGLSDAPVVEALQHCKIRHLAVPAGQPPFRFVSSYTGHELFGASVQRAFAERFQLASTHTRFDVYRCVSP